jgi:hypothetical protein
VRRGGGLASVIRGIADAKIGLAPRRADRPRRRVTNFCATVSALRF